MLWLLLAVTVVFVFVSSIAFRWHGPSGVLAAGASGLICWFAASAALYVTARTAGSPNAVGGTLLSIILRTVVPILVCLALMRISRPLADAGLFGMVLVNYLVVLAVETVLAVRVVQSGQTASTVV